MLTYDKRWLFANAIDLPESLTEKQIGTGALLASLLMLKKQGFLASPRGQLREHLLDFCTCDVVEVIANEEVKVFLHSACSSWL